MSHPGITAAIERLAARFAVPPWDAQMARARREFDEARGRVYDDDEVFEAHVASFLEWYLLERPLPEGEPPVVVALRQAGVKVEVEEEEVVEVVEEGRLLRALAHSHRSLFEVVDTFRRDLLLSDLIADGLWRVDQDPPLDGVDPGDVFEARLIPWEGRVLFGSAFCFHPRQARGSIHALLRQAERDGTHGPDVVFALAEMRLRQSRFRNIIVERIYTFDAGKVDARQ